MNARALFFAMLPLGLASSVALATTAGCLVSFDGYYLGDAGPDAGSEATSDEAAAPDGGDAPPTPCAPACVADQVCLHGGCVPGRFVFVSSRQWNAALGGVLGAVPLCQSLADDALLPGVFAPWLSDADFWPAAWVTHPTVPYYLVDGTKVAADWADLTDGALLHAIDTTERGVALAASDGVVWTNTQTDGTAIAAAACVGFTSSAGADTPATVGSAVETGGGWTAGVLQQCDLATAHLYCFQQ